MYIYTYVPGTPYVGAHHAAMPRNKTRLQKQPPIPTCCGVTPYKSVRFGIFFPLGLHYCSAAAPAGYVSGNGSSGFQDTRMNPPPRLRARLTIVLLVLLAN